MVHSGSHERLERHRGLSVSVIVPAFGQHRLLAGCLAALEKQSYPRTAYEVVVVDNGGGGLAELVERHPRARLVQEPRPGSYAARNRGLARARGDVLAFTDADCIPTQTWIERGVESLRANPDVDAVGGRVTVFAENPRRPTAAELHQTLRAFPQEDFVTRLRFATTANLFVRRRAFERIGPFEAALFSGGDAEWGQRLAAAGGHMIYAASAEVWHRARRNPGELIAQRRRTTGGRVQRRSGIGHPPLPLDALDSTYKRPLRRVAAMSSRAELAAWRDLARFAAIEILLYAVAEAETLRLRLGGRPRRC